MARLNHEGRITHLFIADNISRTASVTPSTLADGEVAFFTVGGSKTLGGGGATNPASAQDEMVIMQGRGTGNPPLKSPVIKKSRVKRYTGKAYAAMVEQIDYIGYNGTSGAIEALNDNLYQARLLVRTTTNLSFYQQKYLDLNYKSDATATQAEIASGLAVVGIKTMDRQPENPIKIERICNDAGVANAIAAGADYTHFYFVNGSKIVTGTNSSSVAMLGSDETNADIVAGVFVRNGTAVTTPVYKVVSATAGTGTTPAGTPFFFELDVPYQGVTATTAVASTEFITAALAAAADFGLKLTGRELEFSTGKKEYRKSRWKTQLMDFGTTDLDENTGASEGVGNYEQIAELEYHCQGNENGNFYASTANGPVQSRRVDVEDTNYSILVLEYDIETSGGLNGVSLQPCSVIIALDKTSGSFGGQVGTVAADTVTEILTTLEDFTGTSVLDTSL